MSTLVTLEYVQAAQRHYHVHLIKSTALGFDHYHNYFQVCFVTCGEILHWQGGKSVVLGPGDAFIIPPGFSHFVQFYNDYSEAYSLAFETSLFHAGYSQSNACRFLTGLQASPSTSGDQRVRLRVLLGEDQRKSMQNLMECLVRQQQEDCTFLRP